MMEKENREYLSNKCSGYWFLKKDVLGLNDRKTFIGLNISVFHMMLGVGMIVAQLPQRILDFTGDSAQVGYLASAFALSYIALQVPIGNLADRYGFKLFLVVGYFLCFLTGFMIVFIGIMLYGVGYGAFLTNIPAFLLEVKQFSQTQVGLFFSLFYVAVSISQMVTGPLSDKFGRKGFMVFGLNLSAIAIFLFSQFDLLGTMVTLTVGSLGLGILCLSSMAYLNETVPNALKGTISGAYYLFWGIGFFFGPIILGRLGSLPGHNKGFFLFALVLAAEAMIMMLTHNKGKAVSASSL
jgi:MFS family permease